jgi:glycerol-3-phosphate dehydrogenase (NAD(P)+)
MSCRLAILGGGSWGSALAVALAPRFGQIRLWMHDPELAAVTASTGENAKYLPGFALAPHTLVTSDLAAAIPGADLILAVVPSRHTRAVLSQWRRWDPAVPIVSATKGIEQGSLLRMSEVIAELTQVRHIGVLSGPTFAREIAAGQPAAVVIAAADLGFAAEIQSALATKRLRLYTNSDVVGVELGAALKNVIAIAAGIIQGLGLGSNTRAALIARGLAEITRLACARGAEARTLAGLAGLGDLVLTCTGELSRNRRVGLELAQGKTAGEILKSMSMVAEGMETAVAALDLARRHRVDLPITAAVQAVLSGESGPEAAISLLMERSLTRE